jgi:hypothetical protein
LQTASHHVVRGVKRPVQESNEQEEPAAGAAPASAPLTHVAPAGLTQLPLLYCGGGGSGPSPSPGNSNHDARLAEGSQMRSERLLCCIAREVPGRRLLPPSGPAGAGHQGWGSPVAPAVPGGCDKGLRHRCRPEGRPRALLRPRPPPQPPHPQIEVSIARRAQKSDALMNC